MALARDGFFALALVERLADFFEVFFVFLLIAISVAPQLQVPRFACVFPSGTGDRGSRVKFYESDSYSIASFTRSSRRLIHLRRWLASCVQFWQLLAAYQPSPRAVKRPIEASLLDLFSLLGPPTFAD